MKKKAKKIFKKNILEIIYSIIFRHNWSIIYNCRILEKGGKEMDKLLIIANILEVITFILIIIAIVFTKKASKKTKEIISYYDELTERQYNEMENLKHLKLQEEHKNRNLHNLVEEIENVLNGKRDAEEKLAKIKKLVCDYQSKN